MCNLKTLAILCGLLIAALHANAVPQPNTAYFKLFTTQDGLPDNSVNDIAEDDFGFIWVATWNGLARCDGKYIETYRHAEGVPGTLSNNMVRSILPDSNGLWVASDGGLDFFRYHDSRTSQAIFVGDQSDEEQLLNNRVSHVLRQGDDVFVLTIEGDLMRLDRDLSSDNTPVFRQLSRPQSRRYSDVVPFTEGRLLALSNEGLTVLGSRGESEVSHKLMEGYFDTNMNIFYDRKRAKVLMGGGIGTPTYEFDVDAAGNLSENGRELAFRNLMSVSAGNDALWLGTDGDGLYAFHGEQITTYTPNNSQLSCDAIYKVYCDSRNNLWIGSYRHGLYMLSNQLNTYTVYDMKSGRLSYNIVTSVVPDGDKLYVGLDGGGIEILDLKDGGSRIFNSRNSALPANNVVSMLKDGPVVWSAVYSCGLISFDTRDNSFATYKIQDGREPNNKLWVLADDGIGNIWVGGNSLTIFNKSTHEFEPVEGCNDINVMSIASDNENMWVATRNNGVMQISKSSRQLIDRFSRSPSSGGLQLPGSTCSYVYVDPNRNMWIDCGGKVVKINLDGTRLLKSYDTNGVRILSMTDDNKGNLLIGTDKGLYKYVGDKDKIMSLSDERMPRMFTYNAVAKDGQNLYFGTTDGLLCYPTSVKGQELAQRRTVFTGIQVLGNESVDIPLFSFGDSLVELKSNQNFFTVRFSLPEMSSPGQMVCECKLEGLEGEWRDVSDTHWATYTNVPAGRYRMLERHSLPDGSWSEPAVLNIKVQPAWYATTGMTWLWAILLLSGFFFAVNLRHKYNSNREKSRRFEVERESADRLNEAKLDFYASITHELRTPCFLISAQIEEMYDSGRQTVPVSSLGGIYRNSAKLSKLISHIIDFRKTETGHLVINASRTDLVALLGTLAPDYEQLCRQKSLTFTYMHDNPPIEAMVDSDKVELIVTNLISNAYKYTPKGGTVTLELRDAGDSVEISVADSGIGIVEKLQSTIFEPYVRTDRGRMFSTGDGIGLSFVKEMVKLHGGDIMLDSQVNEGSRFTVILPKEQPETNISNSESSLAVRVKPDLLADNDTVDIAESVNDPTSTRSVLIIDDNHDVLAVLSRAFGNGYKVTRMSDAREAVELAREGGFDLVVTDLMMPEFDGHQVLRELKSDPRTRDIKVVVFSALTSEDDMLQAYDEGADAYLTKPTPIKVLMRQVDRLFESDTAGGDISVGSSAGTYNKEEQKFLMECRRLIEECMTDENFGIGMLAQRLAMSHSALYKKIRSMTGMSLIDFINEYKIYKAVKLFREGNTNVQTVAEMCGFHDVKTFRETFKRKMNMPPKQFILSLKH